MAWSKVLSFPDSFSYQTNIRAADLEIIPTARGEFRAELTQVCLNQLSMQRARENLARICVGTVTPYRRVVGFLTDANQPPLKHNGKDVMWGDIIVNDGNVMHRRTESRCAWGSMSLALDDFGAACRAVTGYELPRGTSTYVARPSPALMSRLLNVHERVGLMSRTDPDLLGSPEVARAFEQQLIHLMVRCLTDGEPLKFTAGLNRRRSIVTRFEEFLEANPGRAIYLTEICAALGVAERTLRGACEERLGMGPIRYLTLRRMYDARRTLLESDPSETSVTRIATDHGFWELGHFSIAYRSLFGETPSQSLRQPANENRILPDRPLSTAGAYLA
jgi:AraC-like DNA-binding protein